MNSARRKSLKKVVDLLDKAYDVASNVRDEELDGADNLPDNFWELKDRMEAAAECIDEALDSIFEAKNSIENAIN